MMTEGELRLSFFDTNLGGCSHVSIGRRNAQQDSKLEEFYCSQDDLFQTRIIIKTERLFMIIATDYFQPKPIIDHNSQRSQAKKKKNVMTYMEQATEKVHPGLNNVQSRIVKSHTWSK